MRQICLVVLLMFVMLVNGRSHFNNDTVSKTMSSWGRSARQYRKTHSPSQSNTHRHNHIHHGRTVTPGQQQFNVDRPEGTRTFYVWVPTSYDASKPFPVIIAYHGLGDDCENFGDAVGLKQLSETENFLFAYPCGYPGLLGNAWNAGTCCNLIGPNDIDFTLDIVSTIKSNFNVDNTKVYATGFSNGAMMAEILGCVAPDIFHATVSVSGIVELEPGNAGGESACDTAYKNFTQKISTSNIHGDLDILVPWTGDALLGFPAVPTNFDDWAKRNGCQGDPVETFSKGAYTEQTYEQCTSGTTVRLVHHYGGGHEWPSDGDFDTATYVVNFFYQS